MQPTGLTPVTRAVYIAEMQSAAERYSILLYVFYFAFAYWLVSLFTSSAIGPLIAIVLGIGAARSYIKDTSNGIRASAENMSDEDLRLAYLEYKKDKPMR